MKEYSGKGEKFMPPESPAPGSPDDWLVRAGSDLALAGIERPPGVFWEALCFHIQQSSEKAIKAVLVYSGIHPGRTHNIGVLLGLVPDNIKPGKELSEAAILTDYAVSTRYPGIYEPIDENEYREALFLARRVFEWASAIIKK
jgi:HEPN domain-containing protein